MVVGGRPDYGKSELIDISGKNLSCPSVADFSIEEASIGVFIGNKSLVCGGSGFSTDCYSYNIMVITKNRYKIMSFVNFL